MLIFSVHDKASETYGQPICFNTERDAVQGLRRLVNDDKENQFNQFPADFTLVQIGKFDPRSGVGEIYETHKIITNCASLKEDVQ